MPFGLMVSCGYENFGFLKLPWAPYEQENNFAKIFVIIRNSTLYTYLTLVHGLFKVLVQKFFLLFVFQSRLFVLIFFWKKLNFGWDAKTHPVILCTVSPSIYKCVSDTSYGITILYNPIHKLYNCSFCIL